MTARGLSRRFRIAAATAAGCALGTAAGCALGTAAGAAGPILPLPGAEPWPPELAGRLREALAAQGPGYEPRTEHRRPDGSPRYTNRLILEASPYLIQHAHNPVNWFPWGPEAFARAAAEDRPVFLSIGYSTCHWCHVMERESFDDPEIARLLNQGFVAIKVDRERRPDVDELYMTAVVMTTGRGGWPMSNFLTPEGRFFVGGTYFPKPQFAQILERIAEAWQSRRGEIEASAARITAAVADATAARGAAREIGAELVAPAVAELLSRHDRRLGGFGRAPKFPHESELLLLLDRVIRERDADALAAATTSLEAMARGGIYDQVGGGFHRYSTDDRWLVPHFEKMLYNQAHLGRAYLRAARLTGEVLFGRVARQTLDYVLREMTSPQGAFYSATDADSEGREGAFFLWTPEGIRQALPAGDAELAMEVFGVTAAGNFEGENILHLPRPLAEVARRKGMELADLLARLDRIRERLREAREAREHPLRDDKIVTAWNAMMITTLAEAGRTLGEERYLAAAERAARFLWSESRSREGALWRVHLAGRPSVAAGHEDYAYLAEALVTLYDATGRELWLRRAREVADGMLRRFWDGEGGGFFMTAADQDRNLVARPKSPADGAIPSGNSVAVRALAALAARTGEAEYRRRAEATLAAFGGTVQRRPSAFAYMLLGAAELEGGGAGALEYGAAGKVRAEAVPGADGGLAVELAIAPGWHVNAHRPLQEDLIPTRLALGPGADGWKLAAVDYPEPREVSLSFQDEPLAVYQGRVRLAARLAGEGGDGLAVAPLLLHIQACDDQRCLRPEELRLELPLAGGGTSP